MEAPAQSRAGGAAGPGSPLPESHLQSQINFLKE